MIRSVGLTSILLFTALSAVAYGQQTTSPRDSNAAVGSGATGFYQSQVYSGMSGTGQAGVSQGIPYYVEPSRFYYNRPANSGLRFGRRNYYGYYPLWNGRPAYRYGPYIYYPQVRYLAPGVTEHVGPFIPVR
ncbi:hypothetical protein [Aureliella helgolandensis]|uniref:Uncharacterized protein n=1 Tax=Aureliella helgolandensis TaxID=2527968 RepID=A0A518G1Q9_9BACT|nr:hypothetical protein [Aureliella helgolandensis]QDV22541.1 hypothetical protein Q31a_08270 [Aureliella helgolandensis]